ncbi:MAG: hypothetical protein K5873_03210 [Treponema sp.]|nr:hypothetical protein [Treponema sp.]
MIKRKILFLTALISAAVIYAQPKGGMSKEFDAVIKVDSGEKSVKNQTITSDEDGKNGIFAQNDGKVTASGIKIHTKKNDSRGLYVAFGGTINARKVEVTTEGEHCAAFATDMGEGSVTVDTGKALTKGKGSPVIYSTGNISVNNISGQADASELAVIEGKNSVTIEKSNLTGGSDLEGEVSAGVMLYQSMSGDANEGTAFFTAKSSSLKNTANGPFFYVTNTKAVVNLEKTKLLGNSDILILASGNDSIRGWGRKGSNGGQLEFNLLNQDAKGDIEVDEISSVKLNIGKKSSYSGTVNGKKTGKADVFIEKTGKLEITGDSYFNKFADSDESYKNIKSKGHVIYYNKNLEENSYLKGRTILLSDGGKIAPAEYDFSALETALSSTEKGSRPEMGMPGKGEMGRPDVNGKAPDGKGQPEKMELTSLSGKLNLVSDKIMLIDADNKAYMLKVMENKGGKRNPSDQNGQMPPMGDGNFQKGMEPPSDMGGQPPMGKMKGNPPDMKNGKNHPKPVTLEDLKALKNKEVEVQARKEADGTYTIFTIKEKK